MAKVPIALRLSPEALEWLDDYAKTRGVSRQVVLEGAVEAFRRDCEGGVPDLPPERVQAVRAQGPSPAFADPKGTRQKRLNAAMLRSRGVR